MHQTENALLTGIASGNISSNPPSRGSINDMLYRKMLNCVENVKRLLFGRPLKRSKMFPPFLLRVATCGFRKTNHLGAGFESCHPSNTTMKAAT